MLEVHCSENKEEAAQAFADALIQEIKNKPKVALFLSGGSALVIYDLLVPTLAARPRGSVVVGLVDERYSSDPLYPDSNYFQILTKTSLFTILKTNQQGIVPVLEGAGLKESARLYERRLAEIFKNNFFKIAILGIGADGHTAGILPGGDLEKFNKTFLGKGLVVGYENEGEFKQRLTLTLAALQEMDRVYGFVLGKEKRAVLERLSSFSRHKLNEFPAQLLKTLRSVAIFTDQNSEKKTP